MNMKNQTTGKPIKQKVWVGEAVDRTIQPRADIFTPGADGKFQHTGKGGAVAQPKLPAAPKPTVQPAPSVKLPAMSAAPKPAPKPSPKPAKKQAMTPATQSRALAETVTSSFLDRLKSEATRKGGSLSIRDIEGLSEEFAKKTEALKTVFEKSFEEYVQTRERASMNLSRDYPFDRLIVSKFAGLFKDDNELLQEEDTVSRRILPGFFLAVNMMLGAEFVDNLQKKTGTVVKRLSSGRELEFDWYEVYTDKEGKELILDALVGMALYFTNIQKRTAWFIAMINDNIRPFEEGSNPDLRAWTFTERAFKHLLKALFSDLKSAISNEAGRLMISKKYSVDTCVTLAEILKHFD